MAFYVSAIDGDKRPLIVGPFRRHGDALADVDRVGRWARKHTREGVWAAYGTCRHKSGHPAGRFNDHLDVTLDADGYVKVAA